MARPRSFDHDKLRELAVEHPDWNVERLCDELGGANPRTVRAALTRMRKSGEDIPLLYNRSPVMPPWGTIAAKHDRDTIVRYLQELGRRERGENPGPDEINWRFLRQVAENWEEKTLSAGKIVDILPGGRPQVVDAIPGQRDPATGRTKAIAAWLLPGWREPAHVRQV
jgi:hypothetical protein